MLTKTKERRVHLPKDMQERLAVIFAKDPKKPLALSTVSNYLNESRYPNPKAREIRDFAIQHLGGIWVEQTVVRTER